MPKEWRHPRVKLYHGTNQDIEAFVDANRGRKNVVQIHNYDIVIGPIANDGVALQLANYREDILYLERVGEVCD